MVKVGRHSLRSAKNCLGRAWNQSRDFMNGVSRTIDAGITTLNKLQPIVDTAVQAYGNQRAQDFSGKAAQEVASHVKLGQQFASEITSHMDFIDNLGDQFASAFR